MIKRKQMLVILSVLLAVFFIIGIIMYLCGCHDVLQPNCLRYYKTEAKVLDHFTIKKTCTECVAYIYVQKTLMCSSYRHFDCYTSYAVMEFNILIKRTCNLTVAVDYESQIQSLNKALTEYVLFNFYFVYVDKSSFECSSESNVTSVAIAGFSFLVLTGIVLIALLITWVKYCLHKRRRKDTKPIAIGQNDNAINNNNFNSNNNFENMQLNNPREIHVNHMEEAKENRGFDESANNVLENNDKNNLHLGERLDLNFAGNIRDENMLINNHNSNEVKDLNEISEEKNKKSSKNTELENLRDAPVVDFV